MLKLRNLRAVINVTGSGSVSQAARNLNLSQPAVTHAVKRIESQLEITTFDRCHNGMETTKIGKVVTGCIKLALQQIELAKTEIKGLINHSLMRRKSEFSIQGIIKYSHLLILVEVSNYKSIPYAALKIGVTEPVVYRSIRELEDITSTNLFHRGTNFTTSIISGILVRKAKLIFAELRHMHDEIHQYNGRMAGEVIIGTQTSSRTILVPRAIAQLSERYPNLHFSMIDEPYDNMINKLRCGEIDIIVGSVRGSSHQHDVEEKFLFDEPVSILAKSKHTIFKKDKIKIADLAKAGWVIPRKGTPTRISLRHSFINLI